MYLSPVNIYSEHIAFLKRQMPREGDHRIRRIHNETFHTWFKEHVSFPSVHALTL